MEDLPFSPLQLLSHREATVKAILIHGDLSRAAHYPVRINTAHTSNSSNFKKKKKVAALTQTFCILGIKLINISHFVKTD